MLQPFRNLLTLLKRRRALKHHLGRYLYFMENDHGFLWGSISDEEEPSIIELTRQASSLPGPIIEVGALFGFTTQLIATYKPEKKQLIAIENFSWNPFLIPPEHHRIITRRVLRYNILYSNTTIFDGSARTFYESYEGAPPAMVFIDADHSYEAIKEDIRWARQSGARIISGHDYCESTPGVQRAVHEAFCDDVEVIGTLWSHHTKTTV